MDTSNSIIERVNFSNEKVRSFFIDVKRDDLIDPVVSGNKWRKLKYNVLKAEELKKEGILTFGGAFSNHLVATAKACQLKGLKAIGIVRGNELSVESNPTLKACHSYGMELKFVSRSEYREKCSFSYQKELAYEYPSYHIVPEGGRNFYGMIGCQEILLETSNDYTDVFLAGGTGATAAGVLLSANESTKVHVVSALKGDGLEKDIERLLYEFLFDKEIQEEYMSRLNIIKDGHFGGYAKVSSELLNFINSVYDSIGLALDPIYTAKAFYQIDRFLNEDKLDLDSRVLFIHTGGLQGAESWKDEISYLKST